MIMSFAFEVIVDLSGCLLLSLRNKMSISKPFCKEIHTCSYIICTVMYACTFCMYMLTHLGIFLDHTRSGSGSKLIQTMLSHFLLPTVWLHSTVA